MLCISQPAASKSLKHAELRLGFSLFERKSGKLIPTKEAHILFEKAQSIYSELGHLKELADNLAINPEGRLSIGCIPSLGLSLVPTVTTQFIQENPSIKVDISTDHTETMLQRLAKCDLDFAITFQHVKNPNITVVPLAQVPLVYLDDQPQISPVKIDDIDLSRWIHPGTDSLAQLIIQHRQFQAFRLNVQTYYMAAEFVKLSLGCTISDIFSAEQILPKSMIYPLEPAMHLDICLLHRTDMTLSKAAYNYQKTLKTYLEKKTQSLNQKLYPNEN
ncbi:LysR family transcriptional regulator [Wohlfahrtiimonas larvae]|uniref:LysR family transcriptional regulator n=2 Tax=Wohlfahrtiimonas larvae TaxID=1157986 RepID=A0ABP9MKT9_9GAMM